MTFNDVRHKVVRLAGEACQGVEGDGKGLSGRGAEDKQKGPKAIWPAKEKCPVADVPRRAGGVIRAWPGALRHICSSAVSGFTQHMALGWVCVGAGRSLPAHEKAWLQRDWLYFHWALGVGTESKQKLDPPKTTRRGLSPCTRLYYLNAQPCSGNAVSRTRLSRQQLAFRG